MRHVLQLLLIPETDTSLTHAHTSRSSSGHLAEDEEDSESRASSFSFGPLSDEGEEDDAGHSKHTVDQIMDSESGFSQTVTSFECSHESTSDSSPVSSSRSSSSSPALLTSLEVDDPLHASA